MTFIKKEITPFDVNEGKEYLLQANVERIPLTWYKELPPEPWTPGMCFPLGYSLSDVYLRCYKNNRPPITVFLPSRKRSDKYGVFALCLDAFSTDNPNDSYNIRLDGNLTAGERPDITIVYTSIVARGIYHGYLESGFLDIDLGDCRADEETDENGFKTTYPKKMLEHGVGSARYRYGII